jgi:Cu/Ag efflux pump CusA
VERAIESLKAGLSGVEVDTQIYRPATFIEQAMDNLTSVLLISGILVLLALGAFLFEWRSALIGAAAIATSFATAVLVLALSGVAFNMLILAGLMIALVAIVDDAIIDTENIKRRLDDHRQAPSGKSTTAIIFEAAFEMRTAIAYGTAITVLAAAPAFFMQGIDGAFFQPFAISFVLALLSSIVVALTVTPALSVFLFRDTALAQQESPIARSLRGLYDTVVSRTVNASRAALVTAGVIVAAGALAWPMLSQSFLPTFKETNLLVRWKATPGTSRPEMSRIVSRATGELRKLPGIQNVGGHLGRAVLSDEVANVNSGEIWLRIRTRSPTSTRARSGSESVRPPTMTRRWPRFGIPFTVTPASSSSCRPTWTRRRPRRRRAMPKTSSSASMATNSTSFTTRPRTSRRPSRASTASPIFASRG